MAEDELTQGLKKKIGPLPLGVWIIAVGGGIAIAIYMRRVSGGGADQTPTETDTSGWDLGGNTTTQPGVGGAAGTGGVTGGGTMSPPADNDEWFRRASDALVILGASGSQVQASLSKFLGGESLNEQDRAIVDRAIVLIGNPPTAPPPAPNAPPKPPIGIPKPVPPMPNPPMKPKPKKPGPPVRPHLVSQATGRATVAVTSVAGATSYRWFVNGELENSTPGPTVTLTNLVKGKGYTIGVQPQNAAGNGALSGGFSFVKK